MRIKQLPSGTIDIIFTGKHLLLQYNCSCLDALPYCRAICCRMREYTNTHLTEEEAQKYKSQKIGNLHVLDNTDDHCCYLDHNTSMCAIHKDKPQSCTEWHCSPGGKGDNIVNRANGWLLSIYNPTNIKLAYDISMDENK